MVSPTGISIMMKINIREMINENINNDYLFLYLFTMQSVQRWEVNALTGFLVESKVLTGKL
jgi:hypothetical protein